MLSVFDAALSGNPIIVLRLGDDDGRASGAMEALKERGFHVHDCASAQEAIDLARKGPHAGLLVMTSDDIAQLDTVEELMNERHVAWVGLIAQELVNAPRMRAFIGEHLFGVLPLHAQPDHLLVSLQHAWSMACLRGAQHAPQPLAADASLEHERDDDPILLGPSPQMQQVRNLLRKLAANDAPVLITGAAGTGKELAARMLHRLSSHREAPFVAIRCAVDASSAMHAGLLGEAGTLFFDDIDELPQELQVRLVHGLREQAGHSGRPGMRVVAASRSDLAEAVRKGRFRTDLYYAIHVAGLHMPPLADRGEDIDRIARDCLHRFAGVHNRSLRGFSKAAMDAMLRHDWPGNVRELVTRVQRATLAAEGRFVQPEDLDLPRGETRHAVMSLDEARAAAERAMIQRALSQSRNQISRAAALLGVSRVTLYRLMEKHDLRP